VLLKVTVVALPGVNGLLENETVVPAGLPEAVRFIFVAKPPVAVVPNVAEDDVTPPQATVAPDEVLNVKLAVAAVIVKLALLMSKKMFPTDSTFIRAVVVAVLGIVTACVPSFAVPETNVVGKVKPPSVESKIFTVLQLMGVRFVELTDQVMVCVEPTAQLVPAASNPVTANGPAVAFTVTVISVN